MAVKAKSLAHVASAHVIVNAVAHTITYHGNEQQAHKYSINVLVLTEKCKVCGEFSPGGVSRLLHFGSSDFYHNLEDTSIISVIQFTIAY